MRFASSLSLLNLLSLVAVLSLGACGGGKDDEADSTPKDNLTCESECVADSVADVSDCFEEETACIAACAGASDSACVEACGDDAVICTRPLLFCAAECPCYVEQLECLGACEDLDCFGGCSGQYEECASDGSPFLCQRDCDNVRFACTQACEASATTAAELATCSQPCDEAYRPCHAACVE